MSGFRTLALPKERQRIRPKRLRFLVLNTLARIPAHSRERLFKCASAFARAALDRFRSAIHGPPPLPQPA